MNEIAGIEQTLGDLRKRLAELEAAAADASSAGQQLRNSWREASIKADVDGDEAAAERANELQERLQNAALADERRGFAIEALRGRIAATEAELQRAKDSRPAKFFRRDPETRQGFGGIRRALKIPASDWVPVSEDRIKYELKREYPDFAGAMLRSLQSGSVVPVRGGQWEVRAEIIEHEAQT